MIELYEFIQPYFTRTFHFLFGVPHQVMAISYTLLLLSSLVEIMAKRRQAEVRTRRLERRSRRLQVREPSPFWGKVFAYTVYISLGNMLDLLMMDELTGWEGSSQFLVCLDIIRRESKDLMKRLEETYGIGMPILSSRLDALEQERGGTTPVPPEESLDRQLRELKEEITALRESERLRMEQIREE